MAREISRSKRDGRPLALAIIGYFVPRVFGVGYDTIGAILELPVEKRNVAPRPGDIRNSWADLSKSERLLGYRPRIGLEEGLRRTIAHLRG